MLLRFRRCRSGPADLKISYHAQLPTPNVPDDSPPARRGSLHHGAARCTTTDPLKSAIYHGVTRITLLACVLLAANEPTIRAQIADGPRAAAITPTDAQHFVDPLVLEQLEKRRIAGAVVTIVKDGAVVLVREYGTADVANRQPMGPETLIRIGSITKTITALAVMQLVEAGRLDLDSDVNAYLDFHVSTLPGRAPVTLRRLLSHRAGFEDRRGGIGALSVDRLPLGPFLSSHMPPRLRQDDEVVAYSNFNAALAAYVVERASGQSFEQYVADRIFRPLQMVHTTAVQPVPTALRPHVSSGYRRADLAPDIVSMAATRFHEVGSTGVVTTAADMGRLLLALLDPEPGIVSRASLDTMMTPQAILPRGFFGLGMMSPLGLGANAFIGHDGGTGGFQSTLALLPREGFGLFASYNSMGTGITQGHAELLQRIAERYFPGVTLPSHASSDAGISGVYQPTRRVESNLFALRALLEQLAVRYADNGTLLFGPAYLPFDAVSLVPIAPGLFRGAGIEIAFGESWRSPVMQIGVLPYLRVTWWTSARLVVPTIAGCLIVAVCTVLAWPVLALRKRRRQLEAIERGVRLVTRMALLSYLVAISTALWLVVWGWPLAALSSPVVPPIGASIYVAAWTAVVLTLLSVWRVARYVRQGVGSVWTRGRECLLTVVLVILAAFCLNWHVAGTTLSF
jgi:CubicO group peptidase (beta-lactamase class C family)